ncbi:PilZ domain-containing protein [Paenibacillus piri]|nr:PilZ domain-containing protein [Paenibacillus piri]
MMKSKRKEPFRYMFSSKTACTFEMTHINGKAVSAKPAEAAIVDISKSGCKLYTNLNLNASDNRIQLIVNLAIDGQIRQFPGSIRWQKQDGTSYYYGIQLDWTEAEKEQMLLDIRNLAVSRKIEVL